MKLWGGRFKDQPDSGFFKFSSSIFTDRFLWREEILQNAAYAKGLFKAGIITASELESILASLKELYFETASGKPFFSEDDEDIHTAIERVLSEKIGEVAFKVHTGRSRNEQISTDLRLYLKRKIVEINEKIFRAQTEILKKAKEHVDDYLPGYTHLQRAQPVRLAHHLLAWFFMLKRDFDRLVSARKKMDFCPLGSGAIAGNSFNLDRNFIADVLGFKAPADNSMDAVADRDFVLHFLSQVVNLLIHLSRFSEELVLWSTKEFDFVEISERYSTGSSLMPQKKNPDSLELIRAFCGRAIGAWAQVATVLKGLPLTYNRDLQEDRVYLCSIAEEVPTAVGIFSGVISTCRFKTEKMKEAAGDEYLLATDIADYLVRKGLPFRKAHEVTGMLIKFAEEKGIKLSQVPLSQLRSLSPLFDENYYRIFDVNNSLETKNSPGGTSKNSVMEQIKKAESVLERESDWLEVELEKQKAIFENLFEK